MSNILETLKTEAEALAVKLTKLDEFIKSDKFKKLSDEQKRLLKQQRDIMLDYLTTLFARQNVIKNEEAINNDMRFMTYNSGIYFVHLDPFRQRDFDNYDDAVTYRDLLFLDKNGERIDAETNEQKALADAEAEGADKQLKTLANIINRLEQYIIKSF